MEPVCILLSSDREFSQLVQNSWTSLFDRHLLPLSHPDLTILNQLLTSSRYTISLLIVDESLIMHGQTGALDQFINGVCDKFGQIPIIFTFEYSWQFFYQLSKDSIPLPKSLGMEFLTVHLRRILQDQSTVITDTIAPGRKSLEQLLVSNDKTISPQSDSSTNNTDPSDTQETVELRNLVKSALYELLEEIEKNQISLKITLPDKDLWVHAPKIVLKEFLILELRSLLKLLKGEEYSFIEVKVESQDPMASLKILHTEVSKEKAPLPKKLKGVSDRSITTLEFYRKGRQASHQPNHKKAKKVLVIEDEVILLEMIQSILESRGFEVNAFQFSEEAIETLSREKFDMILTDINIPRVSGIQVMDKIKQSKLNRDAKIIVMTGIQNEFTLAKIQEMKPDGFLSKPFTIEALMEQIEKLFGGQAKNPTVQ